MKGQHLFAFPFNTEKKHRTEKYLCTQTGEEFFAINLLTMIPFGPYVVHPGEWCVMLQDFAFVFRIKPEYSQLFRFENYQNSDSPPIQTSNPLNSQKVTLIHQFRDKPIHLCASNAGLSITFPGIVYFLPAQSDLLEFNPFQIEHISIPSRVTFGTLSEKGVLALADGNKFTFIQLGENPQVIFHGETPHGKDIKSIIFSQEKQLSSPFALITSGSSPVSCVCVCLRKKCITLPTSGSEKLKEPRFISRLFSPDDDSSDSLFNISNEDDEAALSLSSRKTYLPHIEDTILTPIGYDILNDVLMTLHGDSGLLWLTVEIIKFIKHCNSENVSEAEVSKQGTFFFY